MGSAKNDSIRVAISGKNQEIEFLRGVSIAFVVFHHRDILMFWNSGISSLIARYTTFWPGVDLFLVISGFVISNDIIPKLQPRHADFSRLRTLYAFYVRRIFRLWPAAWTWLAIVLALTWAFNSSGAWTTLALNLSSTKAAIFQYFNLWEYYCNQSRPCGADGVYWSLSLEEQFYLLYPLSIILTGGRLMAIAVSLALVQILTDRAVWSLLWATRTDALLIGVIIFLFMQKKTYRKFTPDILGRQTWLRRTLVFTLFTGLAVIPVDRYGIHHATGIVAVISGILVYLASYQSSYLCADGMVRQFFVWLGARSYSLYLVHTVAYRIIHESYFRIFLGAHEDRIIDHALIIAAGIGLAIILSEVNYHLIEIPARNFGKQLSKKISAPSRPEFQR